MLEIGKFSYQDERLPQSEFGYAGHCCFHVTSGSDGSFLSLGWSNLANAVAFYTFYLAAAVALQLACFLKYGKKQALRKRFSGTS
jgi:hypothetical protein